MQICKLVLSCHEPIGVTYSTLCCNYYNLNFYKMDQTKHINRYKNNTKTKQNCRKGDLKVWYWVYLWHYHDQKQNVSWNHNWEKITVEKLWYKQISNMILNSKTNKNKLEGGNTNNWTNWNCFQFHRSEWVLDNLIFFYFSMIKNQILKIILSKFCK